MFYVKTKIGESAEINVEITADNVFCRCPKCGDEVNVDIVEVIRECGDLCGTSLFCAACAADETGEK